MKKYPILHIVVVLIALLWTQRGHSQVDTGLPPFASFAGGPFDQINLHDINIHFDLGVTSKAGRGMSAEGGMTYDSSIWFPQVINGVLQSRPVAGLGWGARMG